MSNKKKKPTPQEKYPEIWKRLLELAEKQYFNKEPLTPAEVKEINDLKESMGYRWITETDPWQPTEQDLTVEMIEALNEALNKNVK